VKEEMSLSSKFSVLLLMWGFLLIGIVEIESHNTSNKQVKCTNTCHCSQLDVQTLCITQFIYVLISER
jgi:hypothetical protein